MASEDQRNSKSTSVTKREESPEFTSVEKPSAGRNAADRRAADINHSSASPGKANPGDPKQSSNRAASDKTAPDDQTRADTLNVEMPRVEEKSRRTYKKRVEPTLDDEVDREAAILIIVVSSLAAAWSGQAAAINSIEDGLIRPALQRTLKRLPRGMYDKVTTWTDPITLLIGLTLWGDRIVELRRERTQKEKVMTTNPTTIPSNESENSTHHLGIVGEDVRQQFSKV